MSNLYNQLGNFLSWFVTRCHSVVKSTRSRSVSLIYRMIVFFVYIYIYIYLYIPEAYWFYLFPFRWYFYASTTYFNNPRQSNRPCGKFSTLHQLVCNLGIVENSFILFSCALSNLCSFISQNCEPISFYLHENAYPYRAVSWLHEYGFHDLNMFTSFCCIHMCNWYVWFISTLW